MFSELLKANREGGVRRAFGPVNKETELGLRCMCKKDLWHWLRRFSCGVRSQILRFSRISDSQTASSPRTVADSQILEILRFSGGVQSTHNRRFSDSLDSQILRRGPVHADSQILEILGILDGVHPTVHPTHILRFSRFSRFSDSPTRILETKHILIFSRFSEGVYNCLESENLQILRF